MEISIEQVRRFRLHTHHLDTWYRLADVREAAGACGFQNSPPGAWEAALLNRVPACGKEIRRRLLEGERSLLQAWSLRGAPVVFPTAESGAFLSALAAGPGEPWIYTKGIQLALDALQMSFDPLLSLLRQVLPRLEEETVTGKAALDQTLAGWMLPLLPADRRGRWNGPSPYGEKQTVGGAVVSFLLRPCSFLGLVVFGRRESTGPAFTAYRRWVGHPLRAGGDPGRELVRKYLHAYGPATAGGLACWLGCSSAQAARLWQAVAGEMEPVRVCGRTGYVLLQDRELLLSPPPPERELHLLSGHDPYLGLQDREVILADRARQRQVWQTVSNPGAVLRRGEVVGTWKPGKRGDKLYMTVSLWDGAGVPGQAIQSMAEASAASAGLKLEKITLLP